jgi:8-oxo-dGTP diphosphatase
MKPVKYSVAYAIYNTDRTKVLAVLRPENDSLPNVWGLPASMLIEGEHPEEAVIRSGKQKLGVQLKVVKYIGEGEVEREAFILHMREYEAEIVNGEPFAPQDIEGMTQYQKCEYNDPIILKEATQKGSLCSRIFLEYMGLN